jgi:hypothetical protein
MKHFLYFCILLTLTSCALANDVPEINKLNNRIISLYAAEKEGDWDQWSAFMDPIKYKGAHNSTPFSGGRSFEIVSYSISKITSVEYNTSTPAVAVRMDVIVNRDGKNVKEEDQTDYWVFINGEWYWTWRGWPND